MIERRKDFRAKKQVPLKLADSNFDIITETVDISSSGVYCRVTRNLMPMSKIDVVLLVPGKDSDSPTKKIRCKGVVVRSDPAIVKDSDKAHYNIAIFFTDISKKDRKIAEDYVASGNMDPAEIQISQ
jgi:hypothetical protein